MMGKNTATIYLALLVMIIAVFAVSGCAPSTEVKAFVGGTDGLKMEFLNLPPSIFAKTPFSLAITVQNAGEYTVMPGGAYFTLNNAMNFNIPLDNSTINNADALIAARRIQDTILPGGKELISWGEAVFTGIAGVPLTEEQPVLLGIKACYYYETRAVASVCVAKTNKICEPIGEKTVQSSGAPVQLTELKQIAQTTDNENYTITLTLTAENKGKGGVYAQHATCPKPSAEEQDYVVLDRISVGGEEIFPECNGGRLITLSEGKGSKTCRIKATAKNIEYEEQLAVTLAYKYDQDLTTEISVIPTQG